MKLYQMSQKLKMQEPNAEVVLQENSMDKTGDSEKLINDQIQITLDLLDQLESAQVGEVEPVKVVSTSDDKVIPMRKSPSVVVGDQTMMTEKEYIKVLQENSTLQDTFNESSFFKGILNVEGSAATNEENMALKDVNEQQIKKIQHLQIKIGELEEENEHLTAEHLALMKNSKTEGSKEDSTMADTRNGSAHMASTEELMSQKALKDKQIDDLSSMLAQMTVDNKAVRLEHDLQLKALQ